jgi:uncharacterized membrane protein
MGSLPFVLIQTIVVAIWLLLNTALLTRHPFDPYPFILLNLAFSTQAAYASPLILIAQNRQAERDRARDDTEAAEVDELLHLHGALRAINEQQLAILHLLKAQSATGRERTA